MPIGSPNSIARHASEHDFGNDEWAVYEYQSGKGAVLLFSSPNAVEAAKQHSPGKFLIRVSDYKGKERNASPMAMVL